MTHVRLRIDLLYFAQQTANKMTIINTSTVFIIVISLLDHAKFSVQPIFICQLVLICLPVSLCVVVVIRPSEPAKAPELYHQSWIDNSRNTYSYSATL